MVWTLLTAQNVRIQRNFAHQTDQIDHHLDHLVPHLSLPEVVQDLHRTGPTRQLEIDNACKIGHRPALKHSDHEL